MYDRYCHILDYNDPQQVISIIEEKINEDTADINDYACLFNLYIHVQNNTKAEELLPFILNKFPKLDKTNFSILKNFKGDYKLLWEAYFKKTIKVYPKGVYENVKYLLKLKNVKLVTDLNHLENVFLFKQGGTGDEILFFRWISQLKNFVSGEIQYLSDQIIDDTFFRIDCGLKKFTYNPKKNYTALSIFQLPHLLNIGDNISNQRYLSCNMELLPLYANKTKFRIGLCHHGQNISKLRGLLSIPRDDIVEKIGDRAEIVNLYYGEKTYVKGQKTLLKKEPRNSLMLYPKLDNYEELLAIIETCDVVISCDTSVAHAAGAMGKKTFVLCNGRLYFPWFIEGHVGKSRFYEDVTVVKQFQPANWEISVDKVVNELIQYK